MNILKDILLYFFCGVGVMAAILAVLALAAASGKDKHRDEF